MDEIYSLREAKQNAQVDNAEREGMKQRISEMQQFLTEQTQNITELRVLSGNKKDSRYTLPDACVGAGIWDNTVFAFSGDVLYRADLSAQRFSALGTTIEDTITGYIGLLSNGVALVSCGDEVWAVTLP